MLSFKKGLYFAPDGAGSGDGDANGEQGDGAGDSTSGGDSEATFTTFEEFIGAQPDEIRKLHTDEVAGLKSALSSERQQRKDSEAKLRDAAAAAERGSEAEKALTEQADLLKDAERQAAFYDEAHAEGATNLRLAWMAAQESDAFDKRGNVAWDMLREQFPELFGKTPVPPGDAGKGTTRPPAGKKDMNQFIRVAAGRE